MDLQLAILFSHLINDPLSLTKYGWILNLFVLLKCEFLDGWWIKDQSLSGLKTYYDELLWPSLKDGTKKVDVDDQLEKSKVTN